MSTRAASAEFELSMLYGREELGSEAKNDRRRYENGVALRVGNSECTCVWPGREASDSSRTRVLLAYNTTHNCQNVLSQTKYQTKRVGYWMDEKKVSSSAVCQVNGL